MPQPAASACNPDYPQSCRINSQAGNLMPRIGLAYRVNDKTAVRAGYGLYYSSVPGATLMNLFLGTGVVQQAVSVVQYSADAACRGTGFSEQPLFGSGGLSIACSKHPVRCSRLEDSLFGARYPRNRTGTDEGRDPNHILHLESRHSALW